VAIEIEWSETAIASLLEAVEYIARDSPSYAASLALQAERAAASLDLFPNRGRRVTEYRDESVRELFVGSYRLIYQVSATRISIIAFVHKARDLARLIESNQE